MEEAAGEGRELYRDELLVLHSLRSIITVIKSMRIRWARHVARMGEEQKLI
jgi:hypothetical protein